MKQTSVTESANALLKAVARVKPLFPGRTSIERQYELVGLNTKTDTLSVAAVRDRLAELIRHELSRGTATDSVDLKALHKHLSLRLLADDIECSKAIAVVEAWQDATRELGWSVPSPRSSHSRQLVRLALTIVELSSGTSGLFMDPRTKAIAIAAKELRVAGYPAKVRDDSINVAEFEGKLWRDLDALAKHIGGLQLAELIFAELSGFWDSQQQRYQIVRRVKSSGIQLQRPLVPYGMMINFAVKHVSVFGDNDEPLESYNRFRALCTSLAATYDVQPYLMLDGVFSDRRSILKYLQTVAAFDSLFTVPQGHPARVPEILHGLFGELASEIQEKLGVSLRVICEVTRALLAAAPGGPLAFCVTDISHTTGLPTSDVRRALELLSHDTTPNTEFLNPLRIDQATFWSYPLIRLGSDFLLLDRAVCAPAFWEALLARLRNVGVPCVDERVGTSFEVFVRARLSSCGVTVTSGTYVSTIGEGECDATIETKDAIVFVELKKKALTRRARSAHADAILIDLTHAMLAPHVQTGRHELALTTDGRLDLDNHGTRHLLESGGRRIERVALTLPEFGAFHSREITGLVLRLLSGCSVSSAAITNTDLRRVNETCSRLGENYQSAVKLGLHQPERFFNCWFLGMEALLSLLENVADADSFWRELKRTRHISTGSLNWHFDYRFARGLDPKLAELVDRTGATVALGA